VVNPLFWRWYRGDSIRLGPKSPFPADFPHKPQVMWKVPAMARHRSARAAPTKARSSDRERQCGNVGTAAVSNLPDVLPIVAAELDVLESYLGELMRDMFEGALGTGPRNEQTNARSSLSEGVDGPAG